MIAHQRWNIQNLQKPGIRQKPIHRPVAGNELSLWLRILHSKHNNSMGKNCWIRSHIQWYITGIRYWYSIAHILVLEVHVEEFACDSHQLLMVLLGSILLASIYNMVILFISVPSGCSLLFMQVRIIIVLIMAMPERNQHFSTVDHTIHMAELACSQMPGPILEVYINIWM